MNHRLKLIQINVSSDENENIWLSSLDTNMDPPGDDNSSTMQKPLMDVTEKDAYAEKIIAFVNPKSYEIDLILI